jgi:hypothetical protein
LCGRGHDGPQLMRILVRRRIGIGDIVAQSPASKVIQAAARSVLQPLGLVQKGRSRTWLDDRGWYLIVVEFQPGWSQGSYLNVGCCWLWEPKDYVSFDVGHRVEHFESFQSNEQFAPHAFRLTERAAEQVQGYRSAFKTVRDVATHYDQAKGSRFWDRFHAAIAHGLVGNRAKAAELLSGLRSEGAASEYEWMRQAASRCSDLLDAARSTESFRTVIQTDLMLARRLLRLAEVPISLTPDTIGSAA